MKRWISRRNEARDQGPREGVCVGRSPDANPSSERHPALAARGAAWSPATGDPSGSPSTGLRRAAPAATPYAGTPTRIEQRSAGAKDALQRPNDFFNGLLARSGLGLHPLGIGLADVLD